jgi:hypothetical protein
MADSEKLPTRVKSVLEDPSAIAIANVYAESFLSASEKAGIEGSTDGALEEFTSFMDDVLKAHPEFADLLLSDFVKREAKLGLIDRVIAPRGTPFFTNFLRVLCRHDRLELLPLILQQTWRRYEVERQSRNDLDILRTVVYRQHLGRQHDDMLLRFTLLAKAPDERT